MRFFFFGILVLLFSLRLNAGIIERDLYAPGDGLLTYDKTNRREWLDLTVTRDWNLESLEQALLPNGELHGFALAKLQDLQGLAQSADVSWQTTTTFPGAEGPSAWNLIELIGELPLWEEENPSTCGVLCGTDYDDLVEVNVLQALNLRAAPAYFESELTSGSFNLAIAHVFSFGEPSGLPGQINQPLHVADWRSGGIATIGLAELNLSIDMTNGPYWLYRTIPEPSSLALIVVPAALVTIRAGGRPTRST